MKVFHGILFSLFVEQVFCNGRILNGYPIDIEQAPYMAYLSISDVGSCGGSIVSDRFILTAGHCVALERDVTNPKVRSPDDYTVRVGSTYEDRGGEQYKASTVYCKIWSNLNDIGMLKLSNRISLDGSTKKALSLPTSSDYYPETDMNLYIQGWGTNPNDPDTTHLYRADVSVVSTGECNKYWKRPPTDPKTQVCVIGPHDALPCAGDSGTPLVTTDRNPMQIGLDSKGPGCRDPDGSPAVYTTTAGNLDWIKGVMDGSISGNENGQDKENNQSESSNNNGHTSPKPLHRPSHSDTTTNHHGHTSPKPLHRPSHRDTTTNHHGHTSPKPLDRPTNNLG